MITGEDIQIILHKTVSEQSNLIFNNIGAMEDIWFDRIWQRYNLQNGNITSDITRKIKNIFSNSNKSSFITH